MGAEAGFEPASLGYEPNKEPLLYSAKTDKILPFHMPLCSGGRNCVLLLPALPSSMGEVSSVSLLAVVRLLGVATPSP